MSIASRRIRPTPPRAIGSRPTRMPRRLPRWPQRVAPAPAAYAGWTHVPPRISTPRPPGPAQRSASKSQGSTGPGTRRERRSRSKPAVIPSPHSHIAHAPAFPQATAPGPGWTKVHYAPRHQR